MKHSQESLHESVLQDALHLIPRQAGALAVSAESAGEQRAVQQLLQDGFREASSQQRHLGSTRFGPFGGHFRELFAGIDAAIRELGHGLDANFLTAETYYTSEMHKVTQQLSRKNRYDILGKLNSLRAQWINGLEGIANTVTIDAMQDQTIEEGLLDSTPFYFQGDVTNESPKYSTDNHRPQGCAIACFRMVCCDLIERPVRHDDVVPQLRKFFGTHLIENYQYLNFFHSTALANFTGRRFATIDMTGADFDTIAKIARSVRTKWPGSNVYCVAQLGSETAARAIIHQGVLLAVDKHDVTYHDPSGIFGGPARTVPKIDFVQRWARGLNRALFVIAR